MKYRKKPVVIEAKQLTEQTIKEVYEFIHNTTVVLDSFISQEKWLDYELIVKNEGLRLKTMESDNETQIAKMGDFIIKGVEGEFYPCDPDIFKKTYEEVK